MDAPQSTGFVLWLTGAAFGTVLMALVLTQYVRPIFSERPSRVGDSPDPTGPDGAWLYCEDGAPLDKRARRVVKTRPR